jgi:hypothetical protein
MSKYINMTMMEHLYVKIHKYDKDGTPCTSKYKNMTTMEHPYVKIHKYDKDGIY